MAEIPVLPYTINDTVELNLSYMPYISEGGLFVPTSEALPLGTKVTIELLLPGHKDKILIEGKVVWITPANALYQVLSGVGVQFQGANAATIRAQIEAGLDKSMEIGGYTLGTPSEGKKEG